MKKVTERRLLERNVKVMKAAAKALVQEPSYDSSRKTKQLVDELEGVVETVEQWLEDTG